MTHLAWNNAGTYEKFPIFFKPASTLPRKFDEIIGDYYTGVFPIHMSTLSQIMYQGIMSHLLISPSDALDQQEQEMNLIQDIMGTATNETPFLHLWLFLPIYQGKVYGHGSLLMIHQHYISGHLLLLIAHYKGVMPGKQMGSIARFALLVEPRIH